MSAHTPGPWSIELDMIRNGDIDVIADGLTGIAHVDCRRSPDEQRVPRETALANARLISVAPEFLEYAKLEQQIDDFDCPHDAEARCRCGKVIDEMIGRARSTRAALIAKAEGREP